MPKRPIVKDYKKEQFQYRQRILRFFILAFIIVVALVVRLAQLQWVNYTDYATQSESNLLNTVPLPPARGDIYDRKGRLLAKNIPVQTLSIIPEKTRNEPVLMDQLQKIVPISAQQRALYTKTKKYHRPYQPIPLLYDLNENDLAKLYVNQYHLPGVIIQTRLLRYYPYSNVLGNVLGYVGRINQSDINKLDEQAYSATHYLGKTGIEKQYETVLHGHVGAAKVEIDASGKKIRTLTSTPSQKGAAITLTLDLKVQEAAFKALGKHAGAVVLLRPATGEIIALVSKPSYNPNRFVSGISADAFERLLSASDHPLYNRAIRGVFAAASTVKPFLGLAGLELGVVTPQTRVYDPGWYKLPKSQHIYHDWKRDGHGWVNLTRSITVSCDTYFYNLALALGIERMNAVMDAFGFGKKTGIDLPNELPGNLASPAWKKTHFQQPWYLGDTLNSGIGQGFLLVTPVQLADATAMLANRGRLYQPTLVLRMQQNGQTRYMHTPTLMANIKLTKTHSWQTIIQAMQQVITNKEGTGWRFGRRPGYTVAAKTGTAQVYGHKRNEVDDRTDLPYKLRNNHLFIAFAPVKEPAVAIAVVVEHANAASSIARKVIDAYFKQYPASAP